MPNITGHTELVGLMAYPIRHTQSPTTHNLAYDKNGDDVIQLAFEVDNEDGVGVIELVLILVVLIGLVIVFKKQINTLLTNIFKQINSKSKEVY